MTDDPGAATLADTLTATIALHERAKENPQPVLQAAAAIIGALARGAAAIHVNVPSESTARVQEVQRTLLHVICDLVERAEQV
jgi:hypothetical protein